MTGTGRSWWQIALVVLLALLVLAGGGLALALWLHERGQTLPESVRAQGQATVDRVFADYPMHVVRVSKHEFIGKSWREWELESVERPQVRLTVSDPSWNLDERSLERTRLEVKVKRDGAVNDPAGNRPLPSDLKDRFNLLSVSPGPDSPADFSHRDPYRWTDDATIKIIRHGMSGLGGDDASQIRDVVAAARGQRIVVTAVVYEVTETYNRPYQRFTLAPEALDAADLQARLEVAARSGTAPGVAFKAGR